MLLRGFYDFIAFPCALNKISGKFGLVWFMHLFSPMIYELVAFLPSKNSCFWHCIRLLAVWILRPRRTVIKSLHEEQPPGTTVMEPGR